MAVKKKKVVKKNLYVVRKTVEAESIEDALKKEKGAPVAEVMLVMLNGSKYETVMGFGFGDKHDVD